MAYNTAILQGRFTSDGQPRILSFPSDLDWMEVINFTQTGAANDVGITFHWRRGFAAGTGIREFKTGAVNTTNKDLLAAPNGFTLIDTTTDPKLAAVATTASTNATQPVILTGSTAGLVNGDVVFLFDIAGQPSLGGLPYTIDTVIANTSFQIQNPLANAPGAAGTTGFYQKVQFGAYWFPQRRFMANITQAAQAVVTPTTDLTGNFVVGQRLRFVVPPAYGMIELDGLDATIVAIAADNESFTVDIDTSAFSAFTWPLAADVPGNFAHVWAYGETAASPFENLLDDAVENVGVSGILLAGGANTPGGANNDVMYWRVGKSFSVDNL